MDFGGVVVGEWDEDFQSSVEGLVGHLNDGFRLEKWREILN
jgi:hypothetical protein